MIVTSRAPTGVTRLFLACERGVLAEDLGVAFLVLTRTDWTAPTL
jgi:hypothetical protein